MPTLSQADLVDSRSTSANQISPMPLTGIESAKGRTSFFSMPPRPASRSSRTSAPCRPWPRGWGRRTWGQRRRSPRPRAGTSTAGPSNPSAGAGPVRTPEPRREGIRPAMPRGGHRAPRARSPPPRGGAPPPVGPPAGAVPRHGQSGRMDDPLEDHVARTVEVGRCLQDEAVAPVGPRRLAAEQRVDAPRDPTPQIGVVRQAPRDEPRADGEVRSPRSEPGAGDDRIEVAAGVKAGAERPPGRVVHAVRRAQRDERPVRLGHPRPVAPGTLRGAGGGRAVRRDRGGEPRKPGTSRTDGRSPGFTPWALPGVAPRATRGRSPRPRGLGRRGRAGGRRARPPAPAD